MAGLLASGLEFVVPPQSLAQSTLTPDAALTELLDGNKRFQSGRLTAHDHDLAILKQHTAEKQEPFAAVFPARIRAYPLNSPSIKVSAIFSSRASRATLSRPRSLEALSMALRFWGRR